MDRLLHDVNHAEPRQLFSAPQQYVCFDLLRCLLNRRRRRLPRLTYSVLRGPLRELPPSSCAMPRNGDNCPAASSSTVSHSAPHYCPHDSRTLDPLQAKAFRVQARSPAGCIDSRAVVCQSASVATRLQGGREERPTLR